MNYTTYPTYRGFDGPRSSGAARPPQLPLHLAARGWLCLFVCMALVHLYCFIFCHWGGWEACAGVCLHWCLCAGAGVLLCEPGEGWVAAEVVTRAHQATNCSLLLASADMTCRDGVGVVLSDALPTKGCSQPSSCEGSGDGMHLQACSCRQCLAIGV